VQGWDAKRNPTHPRRERRPRCCAVGRCCDKKITDGTIAYLRAILSSALSHAMREDDLPRNVASAVRLGLARPKLFEPLTAGEARKLLEAATLNRWRVLFELALRTGLRRGELLGLKWTDIDLDTGTLTVTRTLQRTAAGLQLFPTKTVGSQRRILLPRSGVVSLVEHRRRQQAEARGNPTRWNPHGLVFVTAGGLPVDAGALNKNLTTLCEIAGIHRIRFHDLRHSCATLLLEQGVELVTIKELLGHAQIHTTADIYAHVRLRLQQDAIEAMGRALHDDPDSPPPHDSEGTDDVEE
jgi:integrase